MKALTILLYYDRPNLLRNALRSWEESASNHTDNQLVVNDDASPNPAEPVVREVLGDDPRVSVRRSEMTLEKKAASGGLLGLALNRIIAGSDAHFAVLLCDDDMLHPAALWQTATFFEANPGVMSCYGNVLRYDPLKFKWWPGMSLAHNPPEDASPDGLPVDLNKWKDPINGCCRVDASQVAWRLACNTERGCWFDYPRTKDIDAHFFNELYHRGGPTHYAGHVMQYKGVHERQLGVVGLERAWTVGGLDSDG